MHLAPTVATAALLSLSAAQQLPDNVVRDTPAQRLERRSSSLWDKLSFGMGNGKNNKDNKNGVLNGGPVKGGRFLKFVGRSETRGKIQNTQKHDTAEALLIALLNSGTDRKPVQDNVKLALTARVKGGKITSEKFHNERASIPQPIAAKLELKPVKKDKDSGKKTKKDKDKGKKPKKEDCKESKGASSSTKSDKKPDQKDQQKSLRRRSTRKRAAANRLHRRSQLGRQARLRARWAQQEAFADPGAFGPSDMDHDFPPSKHQQHQEPLLGHMRSEGFGGEQHQDQDHFGGEDHPRIPSMMPGPAMMDAAHMPPPEKSRFFENEDAADGPGATPVGPKGRHRSPDDASAFADDQSGMGGPSSAEAGEGAFGQESRKEDNSKAKKKHGKKPNDAAGDSGEAPEGGDPEQTSSDSHADSQNSESSSDKDGKDKQEKEEGRQGKNKKAKQADAASTTSDSEGSDSKKKSDDSPKKQADSAKSNSLCDVCFHAGLPGAICGLYPMCKQQAAAKAAAASSG